MQNVFCYWVGLGVGVQSSAGWQQPPLACHVTCQWLASCLCQVSETNDFWL